MGIAGKVNMRPRSPLLLGKVYSYLERNSLVRFSAVCCVLVVPTVLLPTGSGRIAHILGVYGFQGADQDLEKLALTELHFHAVLCEAKALDNGQPIYIAGDFNVSQKKYLLLLCAWNNEDGWILNRPLLLARAGSPQVRGTLVGFLMMLTRPVGCRLCCQFLGLS